MIKKNKTKRILCFVLALSLLLLVSCSGAGEKSDKSDRIKILCTIYPQYDWVKNIVGDSEGVEVSLLVEGGVDVHSYQPSVEDVVDIKTSDAVILVGGESDAWVFEAIEDSQSEAITLMEIDDMILRGVSDECIASDHDHDHDHGHYHDNVLDEHVWLSLANAKVACKTICEWLCARDGERAELYKANTDKYILKLEALEARFESLSVGLHNPVIFADRFPFVYMLEDYGISYFAAFEGCSADTEADFETVKRLADKISEYESEYVAVCETSDKKLAKSVMDAAGAECDIVVFDSLQSVTKAQIEDGYSYIDAMRENFNSLAKIIK